MQLSWSTCTMRRTRTVTACWFQAQEFGIFFSLPCWTCPVGTWGKGICCIPNLCWVAGEGVVGFSWLKTSVSWVWGFISDWITVLRMIIADCMASSGTDIILSSLKDVQRTHAERVCYYTCSSVVILVKVSELACWVHAKFEVSLCP